MVQETSLSRDDLILPVFVAAGTGRKEMVASMPGVWRMSADVLGGWVEGLRAGTVLLLGVPDADDKDESGSAALREDGIVPSALRALKEQRPEVVVITDVCLCGYTSHGHCGILTPSGEVDNDETLGLLSRMAQVHAAAGADVVAPSGMMDGQVQAIREGLDESGLQDAAIKSDAAKFASAFYGPFRGAAHSSPSFGDRRTHQLAPANRREALRDALLEEDEGADWLMVKPAMPYLDILSELREATLLPIAAYQVSGAYAMLKHAIAARAFVARDVVTESILCIKRAGADAVITYFAEQVCDWLED